MSRQENEQAIKGLFNVIAFGDTRLIESFTDDVNAVRNSSTTIFDEILPNLAYVDDPTHPMASSMFFCASVLAVYLALKEYGATEHVFGPRFLELLAQQASAAAAAEASAMSEPSEAMVGAAKDSGSARPGEFVFEVYQGDGESVDWGLNIKSCAICHEFAKHDAMDLVPYMCASDDVMSDLGKQGLRRSGSIALGAHHCDFTYKSGGEPKSLAGQYPNRIRVSGT